MKIRKRKKLLATVGKVNSYRMSMGQPSPYPTLDLPSFEGLDGAQQRALFIGLVPTPGPIAQNIQFSHSRQLQAQWYYNFYYKLFIN